MQVRFLPFLVLLFALCPFISKSQKTAQPEYYQLSIYKYSKTEQEAVLKQYFETALVPALHRQQINRVGVFEKIANDTAAVKELYVLIPLKNPGQQELVRQRLQKDAPYLSASQPFREANYKTPAYDRMETIWLKAFALMPALKIPALTGQKQERVYELRSYQSPTEQLFRSKVKMFNEGGEIAIFKNLNFNAVFYGEVIAGCHMPNLMYLTTHENKEDRDAHWKSFGSDPAWKRLNTMEEYKNNVSHIDISFLRPLACSDI
ncbi:NIPSNAP family protein [Niabella soli]|uniref:NIPSNAP family containing protein n=1 Tax=Niabella soli DSM 19437 TaxID=929713 RepID=W0F437_9BACT|nr:NIPSNAP family protein [Niabella soli]AHF16583.1 NIPSNAP family containing protein [Niabella soli DSM 19437]